MLVVTATAGTEAYLSGRYFHSRRWYLYRRSALTSLGLGWKLKRADYGLGMDIEVNVDGKRVASFSSVCFVFPEELDVLFFDVDNALANGKACVGFTYFLIFQVGAIANERNEGLDA